MHKRITTAAQAWYAAMLCALLLAVAAHGAAQTSNGVAQPAAQASPTPQAQPSPTLESRFFRNILRDQRALWTAPFHYRRADERWLAPLGLSAAVLFATDRHTAGEMLEGGPHSTRLRISRDISQGGALYTTGGLAATFYLVGRAQHNARARETGLLGAEALIDSGIFVEALKVATQRPRPLVDNASGEFFDRGNSFPSGHAISAWSLATVIAHEYGPRHPLVRLGAYGLASAVSLSRFTGRKHFLSDVLVGSALGYGTGRYVYRAHHDRTLDAGDDAQPKPKAPSKLLPLIAPRFNRALRAYGLTLAWEL